MSRIKNDTLMAAKYDLIFELNDLGEYMLADSNDGKIEPMFFTDSKEAYKELAKWISKRKSKLMPPEPDEEDYLIDELNLIVNDICKVQRMKKENDNE